MPDDPASRLQVYRDLVAGFDGIAVKGKKMPYTAINGNMFSFIAPQGDLCIRLSEPDCAAFLSHHGLDPVVQYGAVMKGYVPVPAEILADPAPLRALFDASLTHARSLKPK